LIAVAHEAIDIAPVIHIEPHPVCGVLSDDVIEFIRLGAVLAIFRLLEEEQRLAREHEVHEKHEQFIRRRLRYRVNPIHHYLGHEPTLICKACGRRYLREALLRQAQRNTAAAFDKGVE